MSEKCKVARIRRHGFSEREIALVRAFLMADTESAYLERDQMQSTSLREEYLQVRAQFCAILKPQWCRMLLKELASLYF